MTTDERLDKLEKELARAKRRNRRLLAVVGLAMGVVALVWIVGLVGGKAPVRTFSDALRESSAAGTVIRANQFVLEDQNGKSRAGLGVAEGSAGLVLTDEDGHLCASLVAGKGGPELAPGVQFVVGHRHAVLEPGSRQADDMLRPDVRGEQRRADHKPAEVPPGQEIVRRRPLLPR